MNIVYPKAARKADRVPLLFEGSSTGTGEFVVNANTPILSRHSDFRDRM